MSDQRDSGTGSLLGDVRHNPPAADPIQGDQEQVESGDRPLVLFVSRELLPFTFGGLAKLAAEYLRHARDLRYVAMTWWHPDRKNCRSVSFEQVRPLRWLERYRVLRGLWFIFAGWAGVLRHRPTVVSGIALNGLCVAVPAGLVLRLPRLSIVYDVDFFRKEFRLGNPVSRAFRRALMGFLLRHSNLIMCGSEKSKQDIARLFGVPRSNILVNPPGVEQPPDVAPAPRPSAELVLVSVGSLVPKEGFEYVIRAVARVREVIPSTKLVLIGKEVDQEYTRRLRDLTSQLDLEESVEFLGRVDDVWSYLKMCDVFVVGSYYQKGFSMPVCEASACGRPVVGTEYLVSVGVLVPGETGLAVPDQDADGLANAIVTLARDPELRSRMGENGRQYVRRFDWNVSARTFEAHLSQLASRSGG